MTARITTVPLLVLVGLSALVALGETAKETENLRAVKAPVLRFYAEVHNQRKLALIPELFADDYLAHGPAGEVTAEGPEGELRHIREGFEFFPDLRTDVQTLVAEPPYVAVRSTGRGTHEGRLVTLPIMSLFEVRNGRIHRAWHHYDTLHSLRQLGYKVSPPSGSR